MIVIGVYDSHNSSVALSVNGEIKFAAQEERFTKRKNESGFPFKALSYVLEKFHLNRDNIDLIAMSTIERTDLNNVMYNLDTVFNVEDHIDMMDEYWKPKLSGLPYPKDYVKNIFEKKYSSDISSFISIDENYYELDYASKQKIAIKKIKKMVSDFVGVDEKKIKFFDHHTCHIMYAYFSNPNKKDKTIGITVDAYGDGRNQTVWNISDNKFTLLGESNECEIARIYRMVTLILRMKPLEHEFKVMGLAPYGKGKYIKEVENVFLDILKFDGFRVIHNNRPKDLFSTLEKKLKYYRFDNIAGGVQKYVEGILVELFRRVYEITNVRNYVYSGGVAMNVKANKTLLEQDFVDELFVPGSSSDESQSIGACYFANYENNLKNHPLNNLYLGPEIENKDIDIYIKENHIDEKYRVINNVKTEYLANLLAQGEILGRVVGKMEFGARALGNRSLLADPSKTSVVKEINEMIKGRDFWMPFAATILDRYEKKYLVNPKNSESRYMSIAMQSNNKHFSEVQAGAHPYDKTIRPQILTREQNTEYYDLINEFSKITGVGALLNTSLNLHGFPVVNDVVDAFNVFEKSGLKFLVINKILISKK